MDYHFDRINQSVPEQMFISACSMSSSVLDRDEADWPSFIDLRLVDESGPPTIHHVRAEVAGARTAAVVLRRAEGYKREEKGAGIKQNFLHQIHQLFPKCHFSMLLSA